MRILLIGATGKPGAAAHKTLAGRGHEIITVGRRGGGLRLDITDPAQVTEAYDRAAERAGTLDAAVSAAGDVPFEPVAGMTAEDYTAGFRG
ncbi:hypothetical protein [Streptomyces sp. NPDC052496]|uniref:hypothetical protein n=1 Tax=Streptomyces sp. NPDC052496 TaxID=3154951 RepID=UPI0034484516